MKQLAKGAPRNGAPLNQDLHSAVKVMPKTEDKSYHHDTTNGRDSQAPDDDGYAPDTSFLADGTEPATNDKGNAPHTTNTSRAFRAPWQDVPPATVPAGTELFAAILRLKVTNGTNNRPIAYMHPLRTALYEKVATGKQDHEGDTNDVGYVFKQLVTPCPAVVKVVAFGDDASLDLTQRARYVLAIGAQEVTVTADEIVRGTAWHSFMTGHTRSQMNLLAAVVGAQLHRYRARFRIPVETGLPFNGWHVQGTKHHYVTLSGQVIAANGPTGDMRTLAHAHKGDAGYHYQAKHATLSQEQFQELLTFWQGATRDATWAYLLSFGARVATCDLHRVAGGQINVGPLGSGKTTTQLLLRSFHGTRGQDDTPILCTGTDTLGGIELDTAHARSTILHIDDGQGDGTDDRKHAAIIDAVLRNYYDVHSKSRMRRDGNGLRSENQIMAPPVLMMERLSRQGLKSALSRAVILGYGKEYGAPIRNEIMGAHARHYYDHMACLGLGFTQWVAHAWDSDPLFPDRIAAMVNKIEDALHHHPALTDDTPDDDDDNEHRKNVMQRLIRVYADHLAGWWLLIEYAKTQGFSLPEVKLLDWAAEHIRYQLNIILHTNLEQYDGIPFPEWVAATIRKYLADGRGHITAKDGKGAPDMAGLDLTLAGYSVRTWREGTVEVEHEDPQGAHIGEYADGRLALDPDLLFDLLRQAGSIEKTYPLSHARQTFGWLREHGVIVPGVDHGKPSSTHTVRIGGVTPQRVVFPVATIWPALAGCDEPELPLPAAAIVEGDAAPAIAPTAGNYTIHDLTDHGVPDVAPAMAAHAAPTESPRAHAQPAASVPPDAAPTGIKLTLPNVVSTMLFDRYRVKPPCQTCGKVSWAGHPKLKGYTVCEPCYVNGRIVSSSPPGNAQPTSTTPA